MGLKDAVAIVGLGSSPYGRDLGRSATSLALEACRTAIQDAGLAKKDVDGLCGSTVPARRVQEGLGLPACTWWANPAMPFTFQLVEAAAAVTAGLCTTAVAYHAVCRPTTRSRSAAGDPFRVRATSVPPPRMLDSLEGPVGYATWAGRYLHEFGCGRDGLARVAVNARRNAAGNERAVLNEPITFDDYYAAPVVRSPLSMLDMDCPVDGADAVVITSAARAQDLPWKPVLLHAAAYGQTARCREEHVDDVSDTGQRVVASALRSRSDLPLLDADVLLLYDGFTIITLGWLESLGFCPHGAATDLLIDSWDSDVGRILLDGRPVNSHGGNLAEGGTHGAGHLREAVLQLRGSAGSRQSAGASSALVAVGGLFFNSTALVLRTEGRR